MHPFPLTGCIPHAILHFLWKEEVEGAVHKVQPLLYETGGIIGVDMCEESRWHEELTTGYTHELRRTTIGPCMRGNIPDTNELVGILRQDTKTQFTEFAFPLFER